MPAILIAALLLIGSVLLCVFIVLHPGLALLIVLFGVPTVIGVMAAIMKGMEKKTVVANTLRQVEAPKKPKPSRLPDPLSHEYTEIDQLPSAFGGIPYEQPVPEPVPAEPAGPEAEPCEGPGCTETLPADPWVCATPGPDGKEDDHLFCTEVCMRAWIAAEKARYEAPAEKVSIGQSIRRLW